VLASLAAPKAVAAPPKAAAAAPVQATSSAQEKHTLSAGDVVLIRVFQEDDLESTLRIGEDGTIAFPLVGAVRVAGQTPRTAAETLQAALKRGYLKNPQVSVTVTRAAKFKFTVLGQVQRPGSYDLPVNEKLTLLQALGMAGGYTAIADPKKVVIKRSEAGKESLLRLNARDMASASSSSAFQILPGDVITVPESLF
jgi:polysaccharide export outer membrane protein